MCDFICGELPQNSDKSLYLDMKIAGSASSGRTFTLIDVFKHWAIKGSKINQKFKLLIPVFGFKSDGQRLNSSSISNDDIKKCLSIWAPETVKQFSSENLRLFLEENKSKVLILADSSEGFQNHSFEWSGHCLRTCLMTEREINLDHLDDSLHLSTESEEIIAFAENLSDDVIENEIANWDNDRSAMGHYIQFGDKKLLQCPTMLQAFKQVLHKHKINIDFEMMKFLVEEGHKSIHASSQLNIDEMERLAFYHIFTNNHNYRIKDLPFLPPYMAGSLNTSLHFKSQLIEDYLAACHVVKNLDEAGWEWLKNTVRFERVFRFALHMWSSNCSLSEHETVIENFLLVSFGLYSYKSDRRRRPKGIRDKTWTLEQDGYCKSSEVNFRNWNFLSNVFSASDGSPSIVAMLVKLISHCHFWMINFALYEDYHRYNLSKIFLEFKMSSMSASLSIRVIGSVYHSNNLSRLLSDLGNMVNQEESCIHQV